MIAIVIGVIVLVILLIWQIQKSMSYDAIMAECTDMYVSRMRGRGIRFKRGKAVYVYTYMGKEYEFKEKSCFGSPRRKVGEMHKIHVNRNKPWKCITSEENTTAAFELAMGIMLILGGIIML